MRACVPDLIISRLLALQHEILFSNAKAKRKKPRTELIDVDLVRGTQAVVILAVVLLF